MRRPPLLASLVVALAVAAMIGLGLWQLRRAEWKDALLADYARAETLPVVDLDPLLASGRPLPNLAFRRVLVTCAARDVPVEARAGRNVGDVSGQAFYIDCRPGAAGPAGRLRINAGWADRPDAARTLTLSGIVAGRLSAVEAEGPIVLTAATATPPLTAVSLPPGIDTIPNNHRMYALQWFFFAGLALVIFVLALRRRKPAELPPAP